MIIWRGNGIAIAGVVFGTALAANLLADRFGGPRYWDTHGWPLAASFAIDSVILLSINRAVSERQAQMAVEGAPVQTPPLVKKNDLFYIGFRWWAFILATLAALIVLFHWSPGPA
ncbi:MAG TPA: hypothetical protein VLW06_03570 [Terriglobales bacterium]|nr:hypothetical protein [Terriglobales bacterium]